MAENSAISWTDHTWNPWMGCAKVSPACDGCYAEHLVANRFGKAEWGGPGKGAGTRTRTSAHTWNDPFRWNRQAEKDGDRPFVFCASLADIFDNQVPAEWRRDAFDVMRRTPRLVYLLLTKRPQLIVRLAEEAGGLPPNAAIGATVEDQERVDRNVPALLEAKAATNPLFAFLSCEPLLGPIDLTTVARDRSKYCDSLTGEWVATYGGAVARMNARLDWIITGGETDQGAHKARPSNPQWFRDLRDQCTSAGVLFHHKQNGEWLGGEVYSVGDRGGFCRHIDGTENFHTGKPDHWWTGDAFGGVISTRVGKRAAGRLLDGALHDARPAVAPLPVPSLFGA